jgi:hypothetical protein
VDLEDPAQGILVTGNISDRSFYPFTGALAHGLSQFSYCGFYLQIDPRPFSQWVGANLTFNQRAGGDANYTDFCEYDFHVTGRALEGYRY